MTIVAGVDFGTLSVRVSLVDSARGVLASASAEYPLHRRHEDPDFATQSHDRSHARRWRWRHAKRSPKRAWAARRSRRSRSTRPARASCRSARIWCRSTTIICGAITARRRKPPRSPNWRSAKSCRRSNGAAASTRPNGAGQSSSTGFATTPTSAPDSPAPSSIAMWRPRRSAGITDPAKVKRSVCAAGHKWLWHPDFGGLPPEDFLVKLDPLLKGVRAKLDSSFATSDKIEGRLSAALGRAARPQGRHSDPGRRVRRALGCDRRRAPRKATSST